MNTSESAQPTLSDDGDGALKTFDGTQREYIDAQSACLRAKGIPVKVEDDGTMHFPGLPADQNMTLEQAQQQCYKEVGIIQTKNFSEEQLRAYYDVSHAQWVCLSAAKYPVKAAQSWETYRDTAARTGSPDWDVFAGVSDADLGAAIGKCPNKVVG